VDLAALKELIRTDRLAAGQALDAALQTKHGSSDPKAMLSLHLLAAEYWSEDRDQTAFHRTHAYVYALEAGDWATVDKLYSDLAAVDRI